MGRLGKLDPNSFSEPDRIQTVHSSIDWKVDFNTKKLSGSVTHRFEVLESELSEIVSFFLGSWFADSKFFLLIFCIGKFLDVRDVKISTAEILCDRSSLPVNYFISDPVPEIGEKLTLQMPQGIAKGE